MRMEVKDKNAAGTRISSLNSTFMNEMGLREETVVTFREDASSR